MTPEDLVEMRAIEELKYRYVRLIDLKRWDELAELFTEDATASYSDGRYSFDGREEIMGFLRDAMASERMLTSHKVHQPEIAIEGDAATAIWALEDVVIHLEHNLYIRGAGFYHDTYVKSGGRWLIKHTGYERVYEEMQPRPSDVKLTASRWPKG